MSRGEVVQPRVAIFMSGLPGAGKSSVIAHRYVHHRGKRRNATLVIDLDSEMAAHPRYDPSNPSSLYLEASQEPYRWADARVEARFKAALADPSLSRVILDGTGTNTPRQILRMSEARKAGWFVKVLYVRVPASIAIERAAARKRTVSPARILSYQSKMAEALAAAKRYADEVETFDCRVNEPQPGTCVANGYVDSITTIIG